MDIRILKPSDIPHVQQANITNLPENYFCKYYMYHALSWPQLSYVAVDVSVYSAIASPLATEASAFTAHRRMLTYYVVASTIISRQHTTPASLKLIENLIDRADRYRDR